MTAANDARRSTLDRPTAMRLAATEYVRFADALDATTAAQLTRPTDNDGWDIRALVGHVVGMTELAASLLEQRRQLRAATRAASRSGAPFIDELTDLQVRKHASDSFDELRARLRAVGPKAARARRRTPGFVRGRRIGQEQSLPVTGALEWWTVGYLVDTILTRDPWMHRVDLSRATGVAMTLTAEHDGIVVADVVSEWAARHGRPVTVTLTGAAGGNWPFGSGGESIVMDAIDFCRAVSGRGSAPLDTYVPF